MASRVTEFSVAIKRSGWIWNMVSRKKKSLLIHWMWDARSEEWGPMKGNAQHFCSFVFALFCSYLLCWMKFCCSLILLWKNKRNILGQGSVYPELLERQSEHQLWHIQKAIWLTIWNSGDCFVKDKNQTKTKQKHRDLRMQMMLIG